MSAFISTLVDMGCHPDIARTIWNKYLNPIDKFMVICSKNIDFMKKYKNENGNFIRQICKHGYLEILKWVVANGCSVDYWVCACAAFGGHLHVLKWLKNNGYRDSINWDIFPCQFAAEKGHLEVLKWLRANNCEWNAEICLSAVEGGHIELLKWAIENGCPWNKNECIEIAESNGQIEILNWIKNHA